MRHNPTREHIIQHHNATVWHTTYTQCHGTDSRGRCLEMSDDWWRMKGNGCALFRAWYTCINEGFLTSHAALMMAKERMPLREHRRSVFSSPTSETEICMYMYRRFSVWLHCTGANMGRAQRGPVVNLGTHVCVWVNVHARLVVTRVRYGGLVCVCSVLYTVCWSCCIRYLGSHPSVQREELCPATILRLTRSPTSTNPPPSLPSRTYSNFTA